MMVELLGQGSVDVNTHLGGGKGTVGREGGGQLVKGLGWGKREREGVIIARHTLTTVYLIASICSVILTGSEDGLSGKIKSILVNRARLSTCILVRRIRLLYDVIRTFKF